MLDPKVFKAYDVRGIYPDQLDEAGAYAIGRGYVEEFEPRTIAVGRDMRLSSPSMAGAIMRGAADVGADVVDLGLVGTEMVYFAVGELDLEGGVMVTASHNPGEYTGMKIVRRGALPVGGDSGLLEIRTRAMSLDDKARGQTQGHVRKEDIWRRWVDAVLSFIEVDAVKPLRVVIDAANGMAGAMLPPVLERLPIDAVRYFFEPDGTFPNHQPNPLLPENREFIVGKVTEEGVDLGVAFDGDADRCFFVDDKGEFVPGDFVTALLAGAMLAREPGEKVIYDVRASRAVPLAIEDAGGIPIVSRVGHAFIKHLMRKEQALFAGEVDERQHLLDESGPDVTCADGAPLVGGLKIAQRAIADVEQPGLPADGQSAAPDDLHARELLRVVRGGDADPAVEAPLADCVVQHLRSDHPDVDHVGAAVRQALDNRRGHGRRRHAHVAADGDGAWLEVLGVRTTHPVAAVLVDLRAMHAADVVRLENLGVEHAAILVRSRRGVERRP